MRRLVSLLLAALAVAVVHGQASRPKDIAAEVDAVYAQTEALYLDLHRNPELSGHEQKPRRS